ncbi:MAG: glycosyltransferase family 4 protein [Acidobacteria bacterium]|nr:glycosyltransferase family 4 protein [Acidobacteriota bacterium]
MSYSPPENETIKERLWVVSELYYPEETSTGYYLTKIAEGLADEFDVKVLCGQPNYFRRGVRAPKHEIHRSVEIFRAAGTTFDKNVIPLKLINMVTLGISVLFHAMRRFKKGDRVLVVTTPPIMPFIICIASLLKGTSYTLLIHDNYPEMIYAVGKTTETSLLTRTVNYCNRWLYKYTAKIIAVARDMRELLLKKTQGLDIPIDVIPNWAELDSVSPMPRSENTLLKELGLEDKFVFLYAGNMGRPNDLESIIEAAARLIDRPEFHFIFLGNGAKLSWLEETVSTRKLKNVTILPPSPRSKQIVFLNACDVALVTLVKKMKGVSMPSRTYNIMAAGKPILAIAEKGSELDLVVNEEGIGRLVEPHDPDALIEAIKDLHQNKAQLPEMGENARIAALEKYSLDAALAAYKEALK